MPRKRLPTRRKSFTQKVKIEDQTFYMTCGLYEDGTLGEIFLDAHKEGTFARGVLSSLARMVSIALQNEIPVIDIVKTLRHMNFPPRGEVIGSQNVQKCSSIADWVAQELEAEFCKTLIE